ncbi:MAG: AAA family ATPase, partial [Myxococcales bacterium]|nr:AAA family ATPase [Myxococcales bacterium]
LFVGVPGLAKTLLVSTLARALDLRFSRIQFTPDLMPSDITGAQILQDDPETGRRMFKFARGPIFANIVLADEINRTPPKTQSALLQSMQEYQVSAGGETHELARPFLVLATQNPIEHEGTYPLPEAQLDRFMMMIHVDYPKEAEEIEIVRATTGPSDVAISAVLDASAIVSLQDLVRRVPATESVVRYAVRLARGTRPDDPAAPEFVKQWIHWGAGPRAGQFLVLGAKARAALDGRFAATTQDVRALVRSVLVHRLVPNFKAEAEGVGASDVVDQLLKAVPED